MQETGTAFDPENVERFDCELGSHYYGEPLAHMVEGSEYVNASDYDALLALYRELRYQMNQGMNQSSGAFAGLTRRGLDAS